jgi:hypothetical protein
LVRAPGLPGQIRPAVNQAARLLPKLAIELSRLAKAWTWDLHCVVLERPFEGVPQSGAPDGKIKVSGRSSGNWRWGALVEGVWALARARALPGQAA